MGHGVTFLEIYHLRSLSCMLDCSRMELRAGGGNVGGNVSDFYVGELDSSSPIVLGRSVIPKI